MSLPAAKTETHAGAEVELGELFRRLSAEAQDLAWRSDGLQSLLAGFTLDGFKPEHAVERLQEADALSQRLHDLAAFLHALVAAVPEGASVDVAEASRRLLLSESVRRYGADTAGAALEMEAGDADLW